MKLPDLNLLVALDILLEEQSVAGAARRLDLSAPAMSRTLSRIRETVGDPILVRAGRGLVPTARALELRELVRKTTETAVGLLQPSSINKLDNLKRQFTIRANDVFVAAYGHRLLNALRAQAPKVSLRLRAEVDEDDDALREGRIDLWISASNALDPEVRVKTLFTTRFLALAHRDHPIFKDKITAERFAAYDHVNVSRRGVTTGPIDGKLADLGLGRVVAVVAPTFTAGLFALPESKLIMPAPEHLVWGLAQMATDIRAFRIPLKLESFSIRQAWHPRLDNDAAHRWLRSMIVQVCKEQPSGMLA
ncbi:MAG TPA: LysR family transcriptional regulator [Lacipirellulaceae bacterium]|jgi:DNA-binding transcriptional LysR family regulator|nr:LysR family transcriptional regulator [Lacipirellulaceae bacterium]